MSANRKNSFGLVADGRERLIAGIAEEARSKLQGLLAGATTPAEREAGRKQIEKETAAHLRKLDSPFNHY